MPGIIFRTITPVPALIAGARTGSAASADYKQRLCFAFAFWNERDPILKERLFGLTGPQGNHGEDVKEVYFYTDNTPSHSFMRMIYRYPHRGFPLRRIGRRKRGAARSTNGNSNLGNRRARSRFFRDRDRIRQEFGPD